MDLLAFNTRRPLFRDVNLRRAVNEALDRPAIIAVWGDAPDDRYVPPALLDSVSGSAYPIDGPDLTRARRLAAGAKGDAVLYYCGQPSNSRVAAVIRANLAEIGIRVRPAPSLDCTLGRDPKIDKADLMLLSPATPIVDPAPFVEAALGRELGIGVGLLPKGWFRDASLGRDLDAARLLTGAERTAAYAALQERLLSDAVPFAALGSWTAPEYVSPRLGCRLFQGALNSLDLAAACPKPAPG
jgi:ABC-type transport system substrate-binding protein